mmetsp:Transcript_16622/g.24666  ORF Transcript_16622/g.24666 Transcript_16622/m.24666 type:complete len:97 (-) Transcript_16622:3129-3419(-)
MHGYMVAEALLLHPLAIKKSSCTKFSHSGICAYLKNVSLRRMEDIDEQAIQHDLIQDLFALCSIMILPLHAMCCSTKFFTINTNYSFVRHLKEFEM